MASLKFVSISLSLLVIQIFFTDSSFAAPSSISYADDSGAYASAGNSMAAASPSGAQAGTGSVGSGAGTLASGSSNSGGGSSGLLLSRSGGGSSPSGNKVQSVVMGSNGDTTILQQTGNQPAKVYTIPGSG